MSHRSAPESPEKFGRGGISRLTDFNNELSIENQKKYLINIHSE